MDHHITPLFRCEVSQADNLLSSRLCRFVSSYFFLLFEIAAYWDNEYKNLQQFLENYQIQKHHTIPSLHPSLSTLPDIVFYLNDS